MIRIRLAIVGSRSFSDSGKARDVIRKLYDIRGISASAVVSGGAVGADALAEEYAASEGIPLIIHRADWNRYGRMAGHMRNSLIIRDAEAVLAFWDMKSPGTRDDVEKASAIRMPIFIYDFVNGILYEQNGSARIKLAAL